MSDYDQYSSDEDSIDLPKTPGAPLNTNRSDDSDGSNKDAFDDSNSSENKRNVQDDSSESEIEKSEDSGSEDEDSDNVNLRKKSHKKSVDEMRSKRRLSSSSSEADEKRPKGNNSSDNEDDDDDDDNDDDDNNDNNNNNNDNDNDNNNNLKQIFGELSDEDGNEEEQQEQNSDVENNENNKEQNSDDENENYMNDIFGEDEDQAMDEEEQQTQTSIEVDIPIITADLGESIHFVKLPNFISIDTHPYDPQTYEDEIDEDEIHDDEGRARLKLKVENTIRWRKLKEDDQEMLESNARVVQWSDGSLSLHLGDEIFDIQTLNLLPGENNHLFVRQGTGLQGQSIFKTKLTFRPFSTESFTHRKLTLSLADKSQKSQKICVLPNVGKDPEANRSEMIKKEEVKLKASIRKENKTRKIKERSYRGSSSHLDIEDDDDESISISKIKNQYKRATVQSNPYSDYEDESDNYEEEDDDSDLDFEKKKSSSEKKRIVDSDDDED